jgi:phosphoribosylformylglycinamidine synthase
MKSAIVVFPGTNRERDMAKALTLVGGTAPTMVWHGDADLPQGLDLVVLPGGFSYGDYLRSGAMGARSPILDAVKRHAEAGGYVLGVCNGFQILAESGLLPGALMRNRDLRFICRDVHLRVETADSPFTKAYEAGEIVRVPVAHHDGNFFADEQTLMALEGEGRVAFRYCDERGLAAEETNPNGSRDNIAGILSANRRVLGMMPHPENLVEPALGGTGGRPLFESITEALS